MSKVEILGKAVVEAVKGYVANALKSVLERLDALEARPAPLQGERGKDADPAEIAVAVAAAVAALPAPKDGKSVTVEDVSPVLTEAVAVAVADMQRQAAEAVQQAVAAIPAPQKGEDGASVKLDDVAPMIELAIAKGLLDLERRATDVLQRACEAMPKPKDGEAGKDGLGFEDLELAYDGERLLTFSLRRGDTVKEFPFHLPIPIYRGTYDVDKQYERGDNVTWAGATWAALKDSPAGAPGAQDSDWKQAVKRGDRGKKGEAITLPSTYKFGDKQ